VTELDIARAIATGEAQSPTNVGGFTLWAIRITSTGRAERTGLNEVVWRDRGLWLNDETLARISGLPVIVEHPTAALNSQEFATRAVGNCLYPYIADAAGFQNDADPDNFGPDIWAVCRIYDDATNQIMRENTLSTSPAVVFKPSDGNTVVDTGGGNHILLESTPSLICHVAICENGVWDRGDGPSGIRNDLTAKDKPMADEKETEKAEGEDKKTVERGEPKQVAADAAELGQKLDKVLGFMDAMSRRVDAIEAEGKAKKDAAETGEDPMMDGKGRRPDTAAAERADASAKAGVQARADAVAMALGSRAEAPMMSETLADYRRRLARGFQRFSKSGFDKVDLAELVGTSAFDAVEDKIYADALHAARYEPEITPGVLREIVKVDPQTGQRMSTFVGDHTFISHMKRPARRVVGINTKSSA
jgi:hypothetical protein